MSAPSRPSAGFDKFPREDVDVVRERDRLRFRPGARRTTWVAGAVAALVLVAVLLYLAIDVLPKRIVEEPQGIEGLTGKDRADVENALAQTRNSVRTTLIQAIGGLLVFLTFAVALGQLFVAREGQFIDRFTKSMDQLGHKEIEVRLGGIYALKQLGERPDYRRAVADIFVAYLKPNASSEEDARAVRGATRGGRPQPLRPDLQAVLRILVVDRLWWRARKATLDLSFITVRNADLANADLTGAILVKAVLDGADLREAVLRDALMTGASLVQADLDDAKLHGANLTNASLQGARLAQAWLTRADLRGADLSGAELPEAHLELADLRGADLSGADLTNAHLEGAVVAGATMRGAILGGAHLRTTKLELARDLADVVYEDADVDDATLRALERRAR